MTSIRRSSRIAAQDFDIHYNNDGSVYRYRKQPAAMSGYGSRMAAFSVARGPAATMKAAFELFRYAINNPLPIKRSPQLRHALAAILRQTVQDLPHPMIIMIADRYLDCMDAIKTHRDYVRA